MTGMTTIIEIDHLMARIGKDRCVTLSVLVADGECFIEASSDFERAGVRLSLPPDGRGMQMTLRRLCQKTRFWSRSEHVRDI